MRRNVAAHVRANAVSYIALVATLAGTSYAAVTIEAGNARATAIGAATPTQLELARQSVTNPLPTESPGVPSGPAAPGEAGGIGARPRVKSPAVAKSQSSTDIALTGNSWTQPANSLELLAGTVVIKIPSSCTGGFVNAVTLSVDGAAATFAAAPGPPASGTVTLPFVVGTIGEATRDSRHTLTAKFGNSCTKSGEDFTVQDLRVDVLNFR